MNEPGCVFQKKKKKVKNHIKTISYFDDHKGENSFFFYHVLFLLNNKRIFFLI